MFTSEFLPGCHIISYYRYYHIKVVCHTLNGCLCLQIQFLASEDWKSPRALGPHSRSPPLKILQFLFFTFSGLALESKLYFPNSTSLSWQQHLCQSWCFPRSTSDPGGRSKTWGRSRMCSVRGSATRNSWNRLLSWPLALLSSLFLGLVKITITINIYIWELDWWTCHYIVGQFKSRPSKMKTLRPWQETCSIRRGRISRAKFSPHPYGMTD